MSNETFTGTLVGSAGSRLVVRDAELAPATAPGPDPKPPATGQRRILWHYGWGGPSLDTLPTDIRGRLTAVTLAMSQSAKAGTGKLTDPPAVTRAQVAALTGAGLEVTIGIGGAGDGGVTVNDTARAGELVASVRGIRDRLGITGITWDLEGSPGAAWTTDAVLDASRQLAKDGLAVAVWSALYGGRLAAWGTVARGLGSALAWWERGFYDFAQANDSRLTGVVTDDLDRMRPHVTRDDQLVASFAPVGSMSRTLPSLSAAALTAARKTRPTVGWSVWEDRHDAAAGWATTRALMAA